MAKRVVLVRHGDDPPDDRVHTWLATNGFEPQVLRPCSGDRLGEPDDDIAGTVLYGGPYNVYETDRHAFLNEEYRWIAACLERRIPMLGICQGAQQIAWHLGAKVGEADHGLHEFGYYEIAPTAHGGGFLDGPLTVCQSHFHTFETPHGAVCLAGSAAFPNQAFRYGDRVFGLQFHAEVTIEGFRRWQAGPFAHFGKPGAQTRDEQDRLMIAHDRPMADWFYGFLDRLFKPRTR
jgi:GMP synthase (glutamine-hydrolysing)